MAEPFDFYTDIATINITPNGVTIVFLRTMPVPQAGRSSAVAGGGEVTDDGDDAAQGGVIRDQRVQAEIIGRARMSHRFARDLRDLLNRTLEEWPAHQESKSAAATEGASGVEAVSEGSSNP